MGTPPPSSTNRSASSDVNALEFVEPYPLLLSCHENGLLCVWHLSTTTQPTTLLLCFEPLLMTPTLLPSSSATLSELGGSTVDPPSPAMSSSKRRDAAAPSAKGGSISCCQVVYDEDSGELLANDIRRGRFLVLVGSNHGEVCVSDLSTVIAKSYVRAYRDESRGEPVHHSDDRSYNPRRRFLRQGKHAKRLQNKGQYSNNNDDSSHTNAATAAPIHASDVACVAKWKAHDGNIRCLRTVDEPRAILTCASDKHVRVWDLDGVCVGDLSSGTRPPAVDTSSSSVSSHNGWRWELDLEGAAQAKQEQAQAIWESVKVTKLKSAMRHQSVVAASREKRRTLSMTSSASAPALRLQQRAPSAKSVVQDTTDTDHGESTASSKEGGDPQDQPSVSDASSRLFDQLQGHATWKQSAFQIAR